MAGGKFGLGDLLDVANDPNAAFGPDVLVGH